MRWQSIIGIGLIMCVLALLALTLLLPRVAAEEARVVTNGGVEGVLSAEYPLSGWVGDWRAVNVSFATIDAAGLDAPLTIKVRLDTPDCTTDPKGDVTSIIEPGGTAVFTWRLKGLLNDKTRNVIWVYAVEGDSTEQLLFAREFRYQSMWYGFFSPNTARSLMAVIALAGFVLLLTPDFRQRSNLSIHKENGRSE